WTPKPAGNRHSEFAPHGCYRCQGNDNWLAVAVTNNIEWVALCNAIGRPAAASDSRFANPSDRLEHQDLIDKMLEDWSSRKDHIEAMNLLQKAGVPAGAVLNNKEILLDEHARARGFYELLAP